MVRFLLQRPIAVFLAFIVSISLGLFLFSKIPVSLLPNIDIPKIIIKITYQNYSANVIESNVTRTLREDLVTLDRLLDIESQTTNHGATVSLTFEHGTKMDLAYISVNEKLDQIANQLPKDLPRPQVIRVNTSDIPIVRIQISPKSNDDYQEISELTEKVIKKRIEQIDGVSLVDVNGKEFSIITVDPRKDVINAVGLTTEDLERAIRSANTDLGSLSVKDGQYRFFVKLANRLENLDQIKSIPIVLPNGSVSSINSFCNITLQMSEPLGYHYFNGKKGLIITVQKQPGARMNELVPKIESTLQTFKIDYPQIDFALSQDQTFLLDEGIQNLTQDLWFGGVLCVILLFLFLGNYASPLLMGISIPVSLALTFIFFYFFNISFNIISLSGLALGIGMLIDNSIIVLDNINRKRREGLSLDDSCIIGVREVMTPVISNVLTTVAIYAPLIYLSGLAGALVYDQAIALTISLAVSLLVAFCLIPVMYRYLLRTTKSNLREDTKFYTAILNAYHKMINHVFEYKKTYFGVTLALMPIGLILFLMVPVSILPRIKETETLLKIDWNSPINAGENERRIKEISSVLKPIVQEWESDIGFKQFTLQQDIGGIQKAEVYYRSLSEQRKKNVDEKIKSWFENNYPNANLDITSAPNAFTQLFEKGSPYLEVRFKSNGSEKANDLAKNIEQVLSQVKGLTYEKGVTFINEEGIEMVLDVNKMTLFGISQEKTYQELDRLFGSKNITEIKRFGETKPIKFSVGSDNLDAQLQTLIMGRNRALFPLNSFISYSKSSSQKYILADHTGVYQNVIFDKKSIENVPDLLETITKLSADFGMSVSFTGSYFENETMIKEMAIIFIISLVLLYFILAVQFENLIHPFLVMLTIPLGVGGGMLVLWLAGGTLNIMAAIGFVVVLGIIVDDPSLKVETINRLRKEYLEAGMINKKEVLLKALHEAGEICLKPLLMVSLTTSLALIPVFFMGGIGNDLQKPMVYVIVGGLTIGTFFTLWFIPLAYWFITRKNK